mgnify:CR=1 FL=1
MGQKVPKNGHGMSKKKMTVYDLDKEHEDTKV